MGDEREIGVVVGFTSHNARVIQIRKFCMNPPAGGKSLRLAVGGDSGEVLCSWEHDECVDDKGATIPDQVSITLQEHCDEVQHEITALLAWCKDDDVLIKTKRLRARPTRTGHVAPIPGLTLHESAAIVGNADQAAIVAQFIRSNELFQRSYLMGHHQTLQEQREVNDCGKDLAKMATEMAMTMYAKSMEMMVSYGQLQAENIRLRAENEEYARTLKALSDEEPSEVVGPETDHARAQLIEQVSQGIQRAAPEAWSLFKVWAMQQAATQRGSQVNGHSNGASSSS